MSIIHFFILNSKINLTLINLSIIQGLLFFTPHYKLNLKFINLLIIQDGNITN